jgi:hypothetical protein
MACIPSQEARIVETIKRYWCRRFKLLASHTAG